MGLASAVAPAEASNGDDDVPRLQVGELLAGRFSVVRFVARGGMGAVYEATDVLLKSRVALKVIRGRIATDATAMERFRREVLLGRRVAHPNVCKVYEIGEHEGRPYIAMQLVNGPTLSVAARQIRH